MVAGWSGRVDPLKVQLFIPCLVDQAAPATAHATQQILERLGHEVHFDRRQTCCGQALFNSGFRLEARILAERFVQIFSEAEAIVSPSGSCVSMVVHHYSEIGLVGNLRDDCERLKSKVFELSQFLSMNLPFPSGFSSFPHSVVYHPSCHLNRDLGVKTEPLDLLSQIDGIRLVSNDLPVECCGFGGAFSAKYGKLSQRIADRRAEALEATGAEFVTGGDDSCLGHIRQSLRRIGSPMRVIHYSRILAG